MHSFGYDRVRFLSREALGAIVVSPNYFGGLLDSGAAHLHPLNYARGLARAALARNAGIFEQSRVLRIEHGRRPEAHTANGKIVSDHLVLAANALIGPLAPPLARRIVPVTALIGTTEPLGPDVAKQVLPRDVAVFDTQPALDYYRLTPDNRLLFGAAARLFRPAESRAGLWLSRRIARVFPQFGQPRMDFVWSGLVDLTLNRLPDVGRLAEGVWYAQGFNGHGVALSTLTGRAIADAIIGSGEDFALLAGLPYRPWPGGRNLARAALPFVRSWWQLQHALSRLRA
jgi:gamma-glutamylputrescine oxidase